MDSLIGPAGVDIYLAGLLPLLCAIIVVWLFRGRLRTEVFSCSTRTYTGVIVLVTLLAAAAFSQIEYHRPLDVLWDYYFRRALNLVYRGVFGYGDQPTAFFVPGYSFMISLFAYIMGGKGWAFFLPNILLLVLTSVFVQWWGRKMKLPVTSSNALSLVVLLYPTRLFSTFIPIPDISFSLVYMCAFACIPLFSVEPRKIRYVVLAGVLAATGALMRPNGLVLLLPLIVGFLLIRSPWRRVIRLLFLVLSFVLVLAPWSIRNSMLYGRVVGISTNAGYNLLSGNNPTRVVQGGFYPDSLLRVKGNLHWNEAQRDSFWMREAIAGIRDHPVGFITLGVKKVLRTFSSDTHSLGGLRVNANAGNLPRWLIILVYAVNNFLYYLFSGVILVVVSKKWKNLDEVRQAFVVAFACVAATVFAMFGLPRFKEPLTACAVIVFGAYVAQAMRSTARKET